MNPLAITSMALASVSLVKEKSFIKENWKPILGIGAALGATYVVWSIYSDFKNSRVESPTSDKVLKVDTRFEPTALTESQALMMANRLQEAMGSFGTSSKSEVEVIKQILTGLTYNDYVKVSEAFGQRGYITATGISKDSDWFAPKKNLTYWLSKELSAADLNALKTILPGVF